MKKEDKSAVVADLIEKLNRYKYVYITDVSSLSANTTNDLRRMMNKQGVKMQVAKNTLILKAMESSEKNYGQLIDVLKGSTSLLFSDDAKVPAKLIKDFRKKEAIPALKGAYIDTDIFIGDDQLDALIKLKSKQELIGEIVGLLQSPAKNVISALQSSGGKLAGIVKTLSEKPE